MSCKQIQAALHDYIDGELSASRRHELERHCAGCDECAALRDALVQQQQLMKTMPVHAASTNFERDVVQKAVRAASGQAMSHQGTGSLQPYYKVAAVVMLFALVLWAGLEPLTRNTADAPAMIAVGDQVQTIKVAIDSEKALASVNLRVEVSDNLELAGFGNKKAINWNTGLREGVNIIALPIIGIAEGRGDIITRVRLNGKEKVMRITTEYRSPGSVMYEQGFMSTQRLAG